MLVETRRVSNILKEEIGSFPVEKYRVEMVKLSYLENTTSSSTVFLGFAGGFSAG